MAEVTKNGPELVSPEVALLSADQLEMVNRLIAKLASGGKAKTTQVMTESVAEVTEPVDQEATPATYKWVAPEEQEDNGPLANGAPVDLRRPPNY
jgi:hypothetical protein